MLRSRLRRRLALFCGLLALAPWCSLFGDTRRPGDGMRRAASERVTPAAIVDYVRGRFEIPEPVKVDVRPLRPSPFPHFYQTVVTVDDGKEKRANDVFITTDARCIVMGNVFALSGASDAEIIRCVRDAAKLPPAAGVTISPFALTAFPDFLRSTVTVNEGTTLKTGEVFVTRDRRTGILGLVLPFRRDFVQQLINTQGQPSVGPARARVTIVEYADLECPGCAFFQKFLENEFLPKYGNKVRIVFKEFPLPSHTWSTLAAVANECAYQIDPSKFLNYRTLIFGNQSTINVANVHARLLSLGKEAGLDERSLGSCLDSGASFGRIDACRKEARDLGINKTPTFFINGRIVVGVPSAATFCSMVDEALGAAKERN